MDEDPRSTLERELGNDRRARRHRVIGIAFGVSLVVLGVVMLLAHQRLVSMLGEVDRLDAEVESARVRRREVEDRFYGRELDAEREPALADADRAIREGLRRRDEAARAYNTRTGSFPGTVWTLFFRLPDRAPLSAERREHSAPTR